MGVYPGGRINGGGSIAGGGELLLPQTEHSRIFHFDQAHYGPVSDIRATSRVKVDHTIVGIGWLGLGSYIDGGSGGGTYR